MPAITTFTAPANVGPQDLALGGSKDVVSSLAAAYVPRKIFVDAGEGKMSVTIAYETTESKSRDAHQHGSVTLRLGAYSGRVLHAEVARIEGKPSEALRRVIRGMHDLLARKTKTQSQKRSIEIVIRVLKDALVPALEEHETELLARSQGQTA